MKKLKKILTVLVTLCVAATCLAALAIPAAAESPQIMFNPDFNPNDLVRTIINLIVGFLALIGAVVGGIRIVMGQMNDDPKERNGGIILLVICLVAGTIILIVTNTVLA